MWPLILRLGAAVTISVDEADAAYVAAVAAYRGATTAGVDAGPLRSAAIAAGLILSTARRAYRSKAEATGSREFISINHEGGSK